MEHSKEVRRNDIYAYMWVAEWARQIPDTANQKVLERFALDLIPSSYIDIVHTTSYVKAINLLLNHPVFDPTFDDNKMLKTALRYYHYYTKGALAESRWPVSKDAMITCLWAHPAIRATYVAPTVAEFEIEVDDATTPWTGQKYTRSVKNELTRAWQAAVIKQCKSIKCELMEKTWHPSRVWDWCFDEDEKREIGTD